jgi:integrase
LARHRNDSSIRDAF